MALTISNKLILATLEKKDLSIFNAVRTEWFDDKELKGYQFVKHYYRDHGELPPPDVYSAKFGIKEIVTGRPGFYLKELKNRFIANSLTDIIPGIMRDIAEDPERSLELLFKELRNLKTTTYSSKDVNLADDAIKRFTSYQERILNKGVVHLSAGIPILDETIYGYRKADLITIGGKSGVGKSWLLIFLCLMLWKKLIELGKDDEIILFITNEMPEDEIIERMDCINGKLPYEDFMKGELSSANRKRYKRMLTEMQDSKNGIKIIYMCSTVDELNVLIDMYNPAAVFLDASHTMVAQGESGWEKNTVVTRALKQTTNTKSTPIINTTQLTRGAGKKASRNTADGQEEFAYTNSYNQDSDIAFRMYQTAEMIFRAEIGLEVVKGRRVKPDTRFIFTNELVNMFQEIKLEEEKVKSSVAW